MKLKKFWLIMTVLACCLLVGCGLYSEEAVESSYHDGRSSGYDEGYNEGYYHAYEDAYEEAREELIDELYGIDGYVPVYMSEEIIDSLLYLVEENGGNRYRPEEYAMIVYDFFEANSHYMTAEQIDAFKNVLTFCDEAEWITRNIAFDIQFRPS